MKPLFFISLFFTLAAAQTAQSQTTHKRLKVIAKYDSLDIHLKVIKAGDDLHIDYCLLAGNTNDSLWFRYMSGSIDNEPFEHKETCRFSFRQLDGTGKPEVILEYSSHDSNTSSTTTTIFNLDTKQRVFSATNSFFGMYWGEEIAKCPGYTYSISFDNNNNLVVKYSSPPCMEPDHKEGMYSLVNDSYTWIKKK